jgi:hypothetical protein
MAAKVAPESAKPLAPVVDDEDDEDQPLTKMDEKKDSDSSSDDDLILESEEPEEPPSQWIGRREIFPDDPEYIMRPSKKEMAKLKLAPKTNRWFSRFVSRGMHSTARMLMQEPSTVHRGVVYAYEYLSICDSCCHEIDGTSGMSTSSPTKSTSPVWGEYFPCNQVRVRLQGSKSVRPHDGTSRIDRFDAIVD